MNIEEYYKQLLDEGCSLGRAQWIYANHYRKGIDTPINLDIAEAWFIRAWRNSFPGTASTQTFVLERKWYDFVRQSYTRQPRLKEILEKAKLSASEETAHITLETHNDAQKEWLKEQIDEIKEAFNKFTFKLFSDVIITL